MKKTMKKLAAVLLSVTMVAGMLTGCGDKLNTDITPTPTPEGWEMPTKAPEPTQAPDATATPTPTPAPGGDDCAKEKDDLSSYLKDLNSLEVAELMGNGINLGNTMEAYGRASHGVGKATSLYETAWGQPVTTQEMISGMKAAGFDTLRVPVAWTNAMNYEDGDYTINQAYLDRVGEIIDYAVNAEMFVIVNDHWDGGWWGMFGSAKEETRKKAMTMYTEMWKQIAAAYKNFDSHLVFESANVLFDSST